jgi:hypothetical protein
VPGRTLIRILSATLAAVAVPALAPPAAPAAGWQAPVDVSLPGGAEQDTTPQVAARGANAAAAWSWLDGGHYRVRARIKPFAAPWFGPVQNLSSPGEDAHRPQVAVDGQGDATFVWDVGGGTVQTRELTAAGVLGALVTLPGRSDGLPRPRVATNERGDTAIAWVHEDFGRRWEVRAVTRRAGADAFGPVQTIDRVEDRAGEAYPPSVAVDDEGNAIVVWNRLTGINLKLDEIRRVEAAVARAGSDFTPLGPVSDPGASAFHPRVAFVAPGSPVVAWASGPGPANQRRVQTASMPAGANAFDAPQTISPPGTVSGLDLASDSRGSLVVAWERTDGPAWRVQARTRGAAGGYDPLQDLSAPGRNALGADATVNEDGDAFVVWGQDDGANMRTLASLHLAGTANFLPASALSPAGAPHRADTSGPAVATLDRHSAIAVWELHSAAPGEDVQTRVQGAAYHAGNLEPRP